MKTARETFIEKRNALVTVIETLSHQLEGKDDATIVNELRRMGNSLEVCSRIGQNLNLCDCIPRKCCNLASIIEEIADQIEFDQADLNQTEDTELVQVDFEEVTLHKSLKTIYQMLAMHVGRLTLDNSLYVDGYAMHFAQKINEEDVKWALKTRKRDEKPYALWVRMHRIHKTGPSCSFKCMMGEATGSHRLEN
jgi:hypothetical protein